MGARPEQQLALNFLTAVHTLWIQHPGTYHVRETTEDIVPALAHMCIKALASDVRDDDALITDMATVPKKRFGLF